MAEHVFNSPVVEEFYNSCHLKANGKFCGTGTKGKVAHHVPMSDAARRSNAVLRSVSSARKSKEYATAKKAINKSWAGRETGQGGLRHVKGANSKKADAARAANAQGKNPANKDGSQKLSGGFKISGNKRSDAIKLTQLDRGSAARKKAAREFQKAYG